MRERALPRVTQVKQVGTGQKPVPPEFGFAALSAHLKFALPSLWQQAGLRPAGVEPTTSGSTTAQFLVESCGISLGDVEHRGVRFPTLSYSG
jgi:hypothetical protein